MDLIFTSYYCYPPSCDPPPAALPPGGVGGPYSAQCRRSQLYTHPEIIPALSDPDCPPPPCPFHSPGLASAWERGFFYFICTFPQIILVISSLQGYLAHKNTNPPGTLQQAYGPTVVLGGGGRLMSEVPLHPSSATSASNFNIRATGVPHS